MPSINNIMLMGRLTRDPELRYLPGNTPVVNIGLAVNRQWKTKDGQSKEETMFIDCDAFGNQAEAICKYMKKGRLIYVEGRIKFEQWKGHDGKNRSKHIVIVQQFQFIDPISDGGGDGPTQSPVEKQANPKPVDEDDIPF